MKRTLIAIVLISAVATFSMTAGSVSSRERAGPVPFIGSCIDFAKNGRCDDPDHDGYSNGVEIDSGSDPNNAASTPEYGLYDEQYGPSNTCGDGIDNDGDGVIDHRDPGCKMTCRVFLVGSGCTDQDHDGWLKYIEEALGSNPNDRLSTPETWGPPGPVDACTDGIDNDRDGLIDLADPSCFQPF